MKGKALLAATGATVLLAGIGVVEAPSASAAAVWTKTASTKVNAYSWNGYRATVTPKGFSLPRGYVKVSATETVKKGKSTVVRGRTSARLRPGTYKVYSTFKYRKKSSVWVPPQYRTTPAYTETINHQLTSGGIGCTVGNPGQPEFAESMWMKYTNDASATTDWTKYDYVQWRMRQPVDLTCPSPNGGTWTVRAENNGYAWVQASVGLTQSGFPYLPNISAAQHAALKPTNPTRQETKRDTRGFSSELLYVDGDAQRWTTEMPPGAVSRPTYFNPAYGNQGPWSGTYEEKIDHPEVTELVRAGYHKTVYGPTKTAHRYRTVTVHMVVNSPVVTWREWNMLNYGDSLSRVRSVIGGRGTIGYDDGGTFLGTQVYWRNSDGGLSFVWFDAYGQADSFDWL